MSDELALYKELERAVRAWKANPSNYMFVAVQKALDELSK